MGFYCQFIPFPCVFNIYSKTALLEIAFHMSGFFISSFSIFVYLYTQGFNQGK